MWKHFYPKEADAEASTTRGGVATELSGAISKASSEELSK